MGILYDGLKYLQIHAQTVHNTNRLGHCWEYCDGYHCRLVCRQCSRLNLLISQKHMTDHYPQQGPGALFQQQKS
jgi:hypothetical protein